MEIMNRIPTGRGIEDRELERNPCKTHMMRNYAPVECVIVSGFGISPELGVWV